MPTPSKLLTIVVPTYNMEKYLRRCLDSLIVSDEQMQLLEVLVINDGSKDSSSQIAHEYQDRYPQTFRVIDKENGNYGSCVNRGLDEATGKYIKILDADDWFDNANFDIYIDTIKGLDVDLVLNDFDLVYPDKIITKKLPLKSATILSLDSLLNNQHFYSMEMHNVAYRTENIKKIGYRQTEGVPFTDQEWMFFPMSTVKNAFSMGFTLYKYVLGREGQTVDPALHKKNVGIDLRLLLGMIEKYSKSKDLVNGEYLLKRVCHRTISFYGLTLIRKELMDNETLIEFDKNLKETDIGIYNIVGEKTINRRCNFKYISWWRTHDHKPLPRYILCYNSIVSRMGNWKNKIKSGLQNMYK